MHIPFSDTSTLAAGRIPPDAYRHLLLALPQLVWISGPDGQLLECNRYWYEYTGASEADTLSGKAWAEVIHPDDYAWIMRDWATHLASGTQWQFDYRLRRAADGAWRWHRGYYLPVMDAHGERFAWLGIAVDTEQSQRTVREHALYSAVVQSSEDAIVTKTLDGIVTSWNKAAERVFGYSAEEMVGRHLSILLPPDRPDEIRHILERLRRGERIQQLETRRRRKDGRIIDVSVTTSPVRDASGHVVGASSIKRDISEQRRMHEALRESEERFRLMADAMPHLVWTSGADGMPDYFNRRWRDYAGRREWEGFAFEDWGRLIHPEDAQRVQDAWFAAVAENEPFAAEYRLRAVGSRMWRWHLARALPVRDSHGELLRWIGSSTDIDDQKRAQEQLRSMAESLERRVAERTADLIARTNQLAAFSYSASHDLRAPLRAVRGYLDTLLDELGPGSNPRIDDYATRISDAIDRMDRLVRELLDFGRVNAVELRAEPASVQDAVASALSQLEGEIAARDARVTVQVTGLPPVTAQPAVLAQVIVNLVSNAIKFVAEGVAPEVTIGAARHGNCVRLWVDDNGIGIAPEHQERIFGIFEQLHGHSRYPGTGVGLALVKSAIDRMQGVLGVESKVGQGSRFWFELPVADPPLN
ncbi:MAG TPA: PAS domain S-box protein [Candidatus Eisenbacteria bacterium]|nr:PAS domain S-box protein [Candidatus Eisenbacteria bacterium]